STQMTLPRDTAKVDSVYMTADTLYSRMIMLRDYKALDFKLDRSGGEIETDEDVDYGDEGDYGSDNTDIETENLTPLSDSVKTAIDSVSMDSISVDGIIDSIPIDSTAIHGEMDSVKTIVTEKADEKLTIEKPQEIKKVVPVDAAKRATVIKEAARADISRSMRQDSILRQQAVIPEEATADSLINQAIATAQTPDTTFKDTSDEAYLDTARTRIVKAYYNVRMFKSDLQAVADSVYYGMADSMF